MQIHSVNLFIDYIVPALLPQIMLVFKAELKKIL